LTSSILKKSTKIIKKNNLRKKTCKTKKKRKREKNVGKKSCKTKIKGKKYKTKKKKKSFIMSIVRLAGGGELKFFLY